MCQSQLTFGPNYLNGRIKRIFANVAYQCKSIHDTRRIKWYSAGSFDPLLLILIISLISCVFYEFYALWIDQNELSAEYSYLSSPWNLFLSTIDALVSYLTSCDIPPIHRCFLYVRVCKWYDPSMPPTIHTANNNWLSEDCVYTVYICVCVCVRVE